MVREYKGRIKGVYELLITVAICAGLIVLSSYIFKRMDLTEEKRHSLTPSTIKLLDDLEDVVFVKVYLKGEYPAEFKRLEQAVRERLDEMKVFAGDNLEYEFINPSESEDEKTRMEFYQYLQDSGLQFTDLDLQTKDGMVKKYLFPGALITYRSETMPLQLLRSRERIMDPQMINNSVNNLEYEFSHILRRIITDKTPSVAFVYGHGESSRLETSDAETLIAESYPTTRVEMNGQLNALSMAVDETGKTRLNKYELLIISDPDSVFSDADRFMLDQFIMRGGKVIWAVDPLVADMDSLRIRQQTMALSRELGLEEMLFQYGVRLEKNMLLDRSCADIALTVGMRGDQPQIERRPWYFKPIVTPRVSHPIVANIDPIICEFASSLDTIARPNIKKTILLSSSENTRVLRPPVRINLGIVGIDPDFGDKKRPHQPMAVLLEGQFQSAFKNRLSKAYIKEGLEFRQESLPTSMLVIADGNIFQNRISADGKSYFTLGFDRNEGRKVYGNREFLINAVNYMLDEASLISVRSRSIKLRQLDPETITHKRGMIQTANVVLPILTILLLGFILTFVRNRRYSKSTEQ